MTVLVGEIELETVAHENFMATGRRGADSGGGIIIAVADEEVFNLG